MEQMREYASSHNITNEQHFAELATAQHAIAAAQKVGLRSILTRYYCYYFDY